jgi:DNA-binding winged helix-turn-helix (wHTH) protein
VVYPFGDFTLDDATRQLLEKDREIHLSPKAFDLLALLLANRTRALSKAELQKSLWPSTFVEETNISGLIAEIRRALHDPASSPIFVRTVYGFGYRFMGEVAVDRLPAPGEAYRTTFHLLTGQGGKTLQEGANVIGRAPDATIQLNSPSVSRYHARIVVSDEAVTLEDLASSNGTYLNGTRVTSTVVLSDGNEIRLGGFLFWFKTCTPMSPTAPMTDQPRGSDP